MSHASARLRSPVSRSDARTRSSMPSRRPANSPNVSSIRARRSSGSAPSMSAVVTMAPALTIGLNGRLVTASTVTELNGLPEGSTPMRARTASRPRSARAMPKTSGFEIDWIVNCSVASPIEKISPSTVAIAMPNRLGSDGRELRDVRRDLAPVDLRELAVDAVQHLDQRRPRDPAPRRSHRSPLAFDGCPAPGSHRSRMTSCEGRRVSTL